MVTLAVPNEAAYNGEVDKVKKYLDRGGDINSIGKNKLTLLESCLSGGDWDVFDLLIERGVDVNKKGIYYPIHSAVSWQMPYLVKKLITYGADVNKKNQMGYTPLDIAAMEEKNFSYGTIKDLRYKTNLNMVINLLVEAGAKTAKVKNVEVKKPEKQKPEPKPKFSDYHLPLTIKNILAQLDNCAKEYTFPMMDNGYIYPVESRLRAYGDKKRWALLIEVIGYNTRGVGHNGIYNSLYIFGNCLSFDPGIENTISLTKDDKVKTFDKEYGEYLEPKASSFLLRGKKVPINHKPEFYSKKKIKLGKNPKIKVWQFLRGLMPEYRSEFLATEKEIRTRIPKDLPLLLSAEEWNHPDLANGEKPGQNETFKMIAKVLETGDSKKYKPKNKANTHWSNWPEAGTL